jgi:ATP-dependent Clp protease adaptor protein ClpS
MHLMPYLMHVLFRPFLTAAGNDDREGDTLSPDGNIAVKTRPATKKPAMYKVLLLNDDYTPMEFVVQVLEVFFNKTHEDAMRVMLEVHQSGVGLCGVFTFEIAETKVSQVLGAARQAQHPLQCSMEKE